MGEIKDVNWKKYDETIETTSGVENIETPTEVKGNEITTESITE